MKFGSKKYKDSSSSSSHLPQVRFNTNDFMHVNEIDFAPPIEINIDNLIPHDDCIMILR